ncbi:MAG: CoA pyrophosphatase [bacterium]
MTVELQTIRQFLSSYQRDPIDTRGLTRASVLMLLFLKAGELHLLLTKRTEDVEHHKGQISFPGGTQDDEDSDSIATALREAEEEVGLLRNQVCVLGVLDDYATPTGFVITPVVGYVETLPALQMNEQEVAELIEVPLAAFQGMGKETVRRMERNGVVRDVYFYYYQGHEIWGVTAAMIRLFLDELNTGRDDHQKKSL